MSEEIKTRKETWVTREYTGGGPLDGQKQSQPKIKKKHAIYEKQPEDIIDQDIVREYVYRLQGDQFVLTETTDIIRIFI